MTNRTAHPRLLTAFVLGGVLATSPTIVAQEATEKAIKLPAPRATGDVSVEAALEARRSLRSFAATPLTLAQVSQMLTRCVSDERGRRGTLASVTELFLVASNVAACRAAFRYRPQADRSCWYRGSPPEIASRAGGSPIRPIRGVRPSSAHREVRLR
jgi:hypothetical protein